jgi:hypothetical protein
MTKDDHVTNLQLYQEIMKLHEKMDTITTTRIAPLERAVDRILVYAGIIGVGVSAVITVTIAYIKDKISKLI